MEQSRSDAKARRFSRGERRAGYSIRGEFVGSITTAFD